MNVNIVGDFKQDAFSVVRAFRLLRNQEYLKKVEKNNYIIWSDCGKHFRCSEFISFLMIELAQSNIHVNLNFFGESHGKNSRDQHFSNISKFIKQAEYQMKLENTSDVLNAILTGQEKANIFREEQGKYYSSMTKFYLNSLYIIFLCIN